MIKYFINWLFLLSRSSKLAIISILDFLIIAFSSYAALAIRFDEINLFSLINERYLISYEFFLIPIIVYFLFVFFFKFYSLSFRFYNLGNNFYILFLIIGFSIYLLNFFFNEYYSNGAVLINILLIFILIISSRKFISKIYLKLHKKNKINSLIVSSSKNLHKIHEFLKLNENISVKSVFLEDLNKIDFTRYQNFRIENLKNFKKICKKFKIKTIFADKFYSNFNEKGLKNIKIKLLETDNLFKNNEIDLKQEFINKYFNSKKNIKYKSSNLYNNQTILITGAGGSIGKNLFFELINSKAKKIILVEQDELKLFNLKKEYENTINKNSRKLNISFKLGSLANEFFLKKIFLDDRKIDYILHAAAYKHVGFGEENIFSFVKNNIFVTYDLAKISIEKKIKKFIFISTDKAVNPTSVMGFSKRICEKIIIYLNKKHKLKNVFKIVRFGNVINSDGSVLPIFEKQILGGRPITVTDKNVTRYFMSIKDACQLVLHTIEIDKKIGIFVLDMGKPYKILKIAKSMIDFYLNKKKIFTKPKIIFIGLQNGEKIYEELVLGRNLGKTKFRYILSANETMNTSINYTQIIKKLKLFYNKNDEKKILNYLKIYA